MGSVALSLAVKTHSHRFATGGAVLICILIFIILRALFVRAHGTAKAVYFDAQDFAQYESGSGRELPKSAASGTFAPLLQHYIGLTQILITLSAASITFGGGQGQKASVYFAKACLACSILYGILFCATMLYRYDEYTQDVRSYTAFWYALVESLGFACLACFVLGYFVWSLGV